MPQVHFFCKYRNRPHFLTLWLIKGSYQLFFLISISSYWMHLQQNMQPVHFVMSATMKSRQLVIWSFSLGSYFYCSHKGKKLAQFLSVYCAHKRYVWLYVCPHACNCYGNRFCSQKSNQLSNWIRHVKLPFSPAMHISWTPRIVSLLVWKQRGLTQSIHCIIAFL